LTKEGNHAAYWPDKGFIFYKDSKPHPLTDFTGLYRKRANHVSDPVKPYKSEEAIMAMIAGKILKDKKGRIAKYENGEGFIYQDQNTGVMEPITIFYDLYPNAAEG